MRRVVLLDCPNEGLERKCRVRSKEFNLVQQGKWFVCKVCGLHLSRGSAIEEDRMTEMVSARETSGA
jgi:hypothetical protein